MDLDFVKNLKMPHTPGLYFFLYKKEILYIGKATDLCQRVKSYYGKGLLESRGPLLVDMVSQADKIEWQTTDSVLEAFILEVALIKKYRPRYNTKDKSDKSFNYVCITKPDLRLEGEAGLPKVLIVRGKEIDFENSYTGDQKLDAIFGPFTDTALLREAMKIIRRIFPYIDASSSKKMNHEFYTQVGLAPHILSEESKKAYLQNIHYIKMFFRGKKKDILKSIKKEMMAAAKKREFERAIELKRQLFALEHINDIALLKKENLVVKSSVSFRIEAYDIAHMSGRNMVGVMTVIENGEVAKNEYKKFKIRSQAGANDTGALAEVLERRFRHDEWQYPNLIVVDGSTAQINIAKSVLFKMGLNIAVVSVVKDERHRPKDIEGDSDLADRYKKDILLANSEAHRFATAYHKNMRGKNFLR